MTKGRKILIFVNSLRAGGAERVTVNLAAYFAARGDTVSVLTAYGPASDFYALPSGVGRFSLGVEFEGHRFIDRARALFRRWSAVRSTIRDVAPDIVLALLPTPSIYAVFASMGLGVPVVVSERGYPPSENIGWLWSLSRRLAYPRACAAVALTRETADWMERYTRCPRPAVIPVSISWPLPNGEPRLPVEQTVKDDAFVFLSVGRLFPEKGRRFLIRAFAGIAARDEKAVLVILGDGPERHDLESLIEREGMVGRVLMPGKAGNVADWYRRANVFVFSSIYEGFGNALAEAMASGRACVSFDCDVGPRNLIKHEVNGLLAAPEDADALGQAMGRLMADEALRRRLADAAGRVRDELAEENVLAKWAELIDQTLEKNAGRRG